jgi:16S rRNA (adenine(1408)-N(1))-methyltransferase
MEALLGKQSVELDEPALMSLLDGYEEIWVDMGCGDGKLAYRLARSHPDTFFIGIDAARENLYDRASRAARSPKKGGAPNLLFIIAPAENLPAELHGVAHKVIINFPWGSLLRSVLTGEPAILESLASLLRKEGRLELLLNTSLYRDEDLVERLGLPRLDEEHVEEVMIPSFSRSGLQVVEESLVANKELPYRTSWGRRLADSHPMGRSWRLVATLRREG